MPSLGHSDYVVCPTTVTSPAPDPQSVFAGMPNAPCGLVVPVFTEGEAMDMLCPAGHRFIATLADIVRGG